MKVRPVIVDFTALDTAMAKVADGLKHGKTKTLMLTRDWGLATESCTDCGNVEALATFRKAGGAYQMWTTEMGAWLVDELHDAAERARLVPLERAGRPEPAPLPVAHTALEVVRHLYYDGQTGLVDDGTHEQVALALVRDTVTGATGHVYCERTMEGREMDEMAYTDNYALFAENNQEQSDLLEAVIDAAPADTPRRLAGVLPLVRGCLDEGERSGMLVYVDGPNGWGMYGRDTPDADDIDQDDE